MQVSLSPFSIGTLIALIVLVLCIILFIIGHLSALMALLIGALAFARPF
jgi:hypothetical protein